MPQNLNMLFKQDFKDLFPMEICSVQQKPFLFTNFRVDRKTVPRGLYVYEVADSNSDGEFWKVSDSVFVDQWGTVFGKEPLDFGDNENAPNRTYYPRQNKLEPGHSIEGDFIGDECETVNEYAIRYDEMKKVCEEVFVQTFIEFFNYEYKELYENIILPTDFNDKVESFDKFIKTETGKEFAKKVNEKRGDFIASDREAAAFMYAAEDLMMKIHEEKT